VKSLLFWILLFAAPLAAQQSTLGVTYPSSSFASPVAATPVDSPGAGNYSAAQTVTITDTTPGAVICYNTSGSAITVTTPGTCPAGSTTYSGSFTSPGSTFTLIAVATLVGWQTSAQDSSLYTISIYPTLSQSCMANASGTSISCPTSTNFTSGLLLVAVFNDQGNTTINTLPTGSGAGCPSSWTNIVNASNANGGEYSVSYGTTQAGACTVSQSQTGSATTLTFEWFAVAGSTGNIDGTGNWKFQNVGAGTTTGASYSTSHSGDLILGFVTENKTTGDSSFAVQSPFSTTSPGQISTGLSPEGFPQMAAVADQASSGTTTIKWTQGVSSQSYSYVLGVY
jgi:hypothetical protein